VGCVADADTIPKNRRRHRNRSHLPDIWAYDSLRLGYAVNESSTTRRRTKGGFAACSRHASLCAIALGHIYGYMGMGSPLKRRKADDSYRVLSTGGRFMKTLAQPSFFRAFDLLLSTTNPGLKLARWIHDGVEFERERHSFSGAKHGLAIEIVTLTRAGRRGWSLMVTKEYWWVGPDNKAFKNLRWARPISGQRNDMLDWMRAQDAALDRALAAGQRLDVDGSGVAAANGDD